MSYQLNKTDGTLLTDLIDGQIDNNSTNLVLVGRNYTGYGEYFNENFIKLLENFANTAAPSNPLAGQLWWSTSEQRLNVYDGTSWKASGGPFVQQTQPQMVAGDLWIDNLNNQLYAFDGTDTILIGPEYTALQGISGLQTNSILDTQSRTRTVSYMYIGGALSGVFSNLQFTPAYAYRILSLVTLDNPDGIIYEGFNVVNKSTFKYHGTAASANALVSSTGAIKTADNFLVSDGPSITTGTLTIQNSGGLTIGALQNNVQRITGPRFYIENQIVDHDISLRVASSNFGSAIVDGIYVNASTARVGIFNVGRMPEYTLDVEGDLRVTGNLIVEGDTISLDVATLSVEDKNIELAKLADGTLLDAVAADDSGIIINVTQSSVPATKQFVWKHATDAWTSNVNINTSNSANSYQIAGVDKLTNTHLTNITKALDLNEIGALLYLNVDSIGIDGTIISSSSTMNITAATGINITSAGDIAIQDSQKITGLADPVDAQDAVTKIYADTQVSVEPIVFNLDTTGLGTGAALQTAVASYLTDLYPVTGITTNKIARIHTTSYTSAAVSGIDVEGIKTLATVAVDANGTQNETVVQDVTFDPAGASGVVTLTPDRALLTYQSNGTVWVYQATVVY